MRNQQRMDKAMKVVVDALVYEMSMCIDKEIANEVRGCQLGRCQRLEIILSKMQRSRCIVSQTKEDKMIWLPQKRVFGKNAIMHKLEPDTWEVTNVDEKRFEVDAYASAVEFLYEGIAPRSIANNKAFFELLNWGYLKLVPERKECCRVFDLTEEGRRLGIET